MEITVKPSKAIEREYTLKDFPTKQIGIVVQSQACSFNEGDVFIKNDKDQITFLDSGHAPIQPLAFYNLTMARVIRPGEVIELIG